MQQVFLTSVSPAEYARQGREFDFPTPEACLNPQCLISIPPKKHGFYERYCIDFGYNGRIPIRRYYCPFCGKTISYLPSFCLPYYQYSLAVIYMVIVGYFECGVSFSQIIRHLREHHPKLHLELGHIEFYILRFMMNLHSIQLALRQFIPDLPLPDFGLDIKEGAKKILVIVKNGFNTIQAFSQGFFAQCKRSFLSPLQNSLA